MGYILQTFWDIFAKPMVCIRNIYRIDWAKTIGYIMGYICQKLWDIYLSKTNGYIG